MTAIAQTVVLVSAWWLLVITLIERKHRRDLIDEYQRGASDQRAARATVGTPWQWGGRR